LTLVATNEAIAKGMSLERRKGIAIKRSRRELKKVCEPTESLYNIFMDPREATFAKCLSVQP
jgi:hypothetical protein